MRHACLKSRAVFQTEISGAGSASISQDFLNLKGGVVAACGDQQARVETGLLIVLSFFRSSRFFGDWKL